MQGYIDYVKGEQSDCNMSQESVIRFSYAIHHDRIDSLVIFATRKSFRNISEI